MRATRYVSSKFTVEDYEMLKKKAEELRIPVGALIRMLTMRGLKGELGGN